MTRKAWRGWVMGAIVAVGVGLPGSANAQFVLTKDFGAPTDVVGFRSSGGRRESPAFADRQPRSSAGRVRPAGSLDDRQSRR